MNYPLFQLYTFVVGSSLLCRSGPLNLSPQMLSAFTRMYPMGKRFLDAFSNHGLIGAHPEMDGHPIGVHRKFGRAQGMRKILPQAYG